MLIKNYDGEVVLVLKNGFYRAPTQREVADSQYRPTNDGGLDECKILQEFDTRSVNQLFDVITGTLI